MNTCDQEEIKHQLLQKFYELAEKPEEWYASSMNSLTHPSGLRVSYNFAALYAGDVFVYRESREKLEKVEEEYVKKGWFRSTVRTRIVEKWVEQSSPFLTAIKNLRDSVFTLQTCKALEEALKRVSQEEKPKKGRKAKEA